MMNAKPVDREQLSVSTLSTEHLSQEQTEAQRVFISYSRQQFYFAESLALHLQKEGIATWFDVQRLEPGSDWAEGIQQGLTACASVVLIASRASLSSEYVEKEWKAVMAAGKRVLVALFDEVELPPEFEASSIPIIDFRRDFRNALDTLLACIRSGTVHRDFVPRPGALSISRRTSRPVVLLGLELLLSPLLTLGYLITTLVLNLPSLSTLSGNDLTNNLTIITMFGMMFGTLSCWVLYTWWTFLHRRFNFTDLRQISLGAPWLTLFFVGFLSPWGFDFWSLPRPLWEVSLAVAAGLALLGLFNFVIWGMGRSSDALRWLPTGEAPQAFRRRHIRSLLGSTTFAAAVSARRRDYELHYWPSDAEIASKVKSVLAKPPKFGEGPSFLVRAGQAIRSWLGLGQPSPAGSGRGAVCEPLGFDRTQPATDEKLQVVILSNKTPGVAVESILAEHGKVIAVIASGIEIPSDISQFTQYQWVDFRNQSEEQLSVLALYLRDFDPGPTGYSLSVVPESLQKPVVPAGVALGTKFVQVLAGYFIGVGAVEALVLLVNPTGERMMPPLALAALVAAGLMQFIAVGMALDRRVTSDVLAAVLVASLVAMGASGSWDLLGLLQSGICIFAFWRACTDWLPVDAPQKASGPTLALPARKVWTRHLLFVGAIVLFFVLPFGLVAALVP